MFRRDLLGALHSDKYGDIKANWHNVAPRLGFAYSMPWSTVLRGGFGMTYYPNNYGPGTTSLNPPYSQSYTCTNSSVATGGTAMGATGPCSNITGPLVDGLPAPGVTDVTSLTNTATIPTYYATETLSSTDPNLKPSYLYQYSLQGQKDWRGNIITVGYLGNIGRRLSMSENWNQPVNSINADNPAANFDRPFNDLTNYTCSPPSSSCNASSATLQSIATAAITTLSDNMSSVYDALQATVLRRSTMGLTTSINYTYAHLTGNNYLLNENGNQTPLCIRNGCIVDNGSGSAATGTLEGSKYDWGNGDLDVRQRISGVLTYQMPWLKNNHMFYGIVHAAGAGWTANLMGTWQTGLHFSASPTSTGGTTGSFKGAGQSCLSPLTVYADVMANASNPHYVVPQPAWCSTYWSGLAGEARPNLVPGCNPNKNTATFKKSLDEWFNTDCYSLQTYGTFGDEHRNQVEGPREQKADVSVNKTFDVTERYKLQLRMEGFNITNTPSYGTPNYSPSCWNYTGASSCYAYTLAAAQAASSTPLLASSERSLAVANCESNRNSLLGAAPPPGGGGTNAVGCVTSLQTSNREFQFALRLTF